MKTLEKLVVLVAAGSILTFAEGCGSKKPVYEPQSKIVRVGVPVPSECKSDARLAITGKYKYTDHLVVYCKDEQQRELACTCESETIYCYHLVEKGK